MDIETLVKEVQNYVRREDASGRRFWVVFLTRSDEPVTDKWMMVFSAPWIDKQGEKRALTEIVRGLRESLSPDAASAISSIAALPTRHPVVEALGSHLKVPLGKKLHVVRNMIIAGQTFPETHLILSRIPSRTASRKRAKPQRVKD